MIFNLLIFLIYVLILPNQILCAENYDLMNFQSVEF